MCKKLGIFALLFILLITGCASKHKALKTYTTIYYTIPKHKTPSHDACLELNYAKATGKVGLAFSGGGSRALSATMGYMRGLDYLGHLTQASHISAVSGGAWASTVYTYLPNTIHDADFLGKRQLPGEITWDNLAIQTANNLGKVPQHLGILDDVYSILALKLRYDYSDHELWVRLIGERVLKPFGLSEVDKNGRPSRYYSYTAKYLDECILKQNPGLKRSDFYLVERKRPQLIVNTSMFKNHQERTELMPVESTSFGMGIRNTFVNEGLGQRDIGGGEIQPFAFNSIDPIKINAHQAKVKVGQRFSLSDIAGLSSSAFAETFESKYHQIFDSLLPQYNYWPVAKFSNGATPYWFADGGNLENTGINSLLARRVPTIISFINSEFEIKCIANCNQGIKVIQVDPDLPPLFGYMPLGKGNKYILYCNDSRNECTVPNKYLPFNGNQVFPSDDFQKLTEQLLKAKTEGGPVMFLQSGLAVQTNKKFNVPGGQLTQVLWVYNSKSTNWWAKLPQQLQERLMCKNWHEFNNFPHYNTITQLELSARQVNLLAHMTEWMMTQDDYSIVGSGLTSKALLKKLFFSN